MINGRSTESRSTLSVCILLDAPNPATPRSTVAPASPLPRNRSSNASYNGLPWYLSLSPMKTRMSVRSPRNCSVIGASQEFVAERRSQQHGDDATHDRRAHVEGGTQVVAVIQERDAFVAERTHRRKGTAESDGQAGPHIRRDECGSSRQSQNKAEQQGTGEIRGECAEREAARGTALHPAFEPVAREGAGDPAVAARSAVAALAATAARRIVSFHACRTFVSHCHSSGPPKASTRTTSRASAPSSRRPRSSTPSPTSSSFPRPRRRAISSKVVCRSWRSPPA